MVTPMKQLWYAESHGLHGGWMPQTTPYEPQIKTSGGHTREADMGRIGRRIRAIQPIAAEHIGLGLDDLQAIYGADAVKTLNTNEACHDNG
jgi:hypothetical protein